MNKNVIVFAGLVALTFVAGALVGLPRQQVIALGLFGVMLFGTLFFWRYRLAFALLSVAAMLALGLTDIPHVVESAGLDIILFLIGMMVLVGFLEERHFFDALIDAILGRVGGDGRKLILIMMVLSAFFAALVDEVTSTLFMMAALFQVTTKYRINPLPFLIMLVFATNVGSSATVVGNPVGIIIALRANLSFADFLRWASPISFVVLALTVVLSFVFFSTDIRSLTAHLKHDHGDGGELAKNGRRILGKEFANCWILFLATILALVFHAPLEHLLGLPKNTLLLAVALMAAGVALLMEREKARELLEKRVDWWTLAFFMLLFATVGTLRYVGVTASMARGIVSVSGENSTVLFLAVTWSTALLSAFMDNVLAVSTFVPVIKDLETLGLNIGPLWWGMLFGGTLGGNATMIGSTANIVALGLMERRALGHVTFGQWIKAGLLITIPTLALASALLLLQLRP
ncbi:MAG: anion permease [Chloroflexi bacterium]|nr:anion permease [Chloroflexota bacterium]